MLNSRALKQELATELSAKFRGTASIKAEIFEFASQYPADEDDKHPQRMKKLFKEAKNTRKWDIFNHIPATIAQDQLDEALTLAGITSTQLLHARGGHLELDFPAGVRLKCLRGRHRVLGDSRSLRPGRRWTVDLFTSDLSPDLQTTLTEEYTCEKGPKDGEIYVNIRTYGDRNAKSYNELFASRWWSLLHGMSPHKYRTMKQILRHDKYRRYFDIQMDIPALGNDMMLSTIHKMFAMRCHEEILCYLRYINNFWRGIFNGDRQAMQKLDYSTVKSLELTAPGTCKVEKDTLYQKLQIGKIFGAFAPNEREQIWKEVLRRSSIRLVPTFLSFFEDVKYLQGPAKSVRALIDEEEFETLSSAMWEMYPASSREQNRCTIQTAASEFISVETGMLDKFDLARRQVWVSAMRNHREMPIQKLDDNLLALPIFERNESVVFRFALLAHRSGLKSKIISDLISRSPDRYIVGNAPDGPQSNIQDTESTTRPPRRCGVPNTGDYKIDKASLFLDKLHNITDEHEITSFFIRRSVYFHFFVEADESGIDRDTTHIPVEQGQAEEEPRVIYSDQQQIYMGANQAREDIENRTREVKEHDRKLQEREGLLQLRERQLEEYQQRIETEQGAQNKLLKEAHEKVAAVQGRERELTEHMKHLKEYQQRTEIENDARLTFTRDIEEKLKEAQERERKFQEREKHLEEYQQRTENEQGAQHTLLREAQAELAAAQKRENELEERVKQLEDEKKEMQVTLQNAEQVNTIRKSQERLLNGRQEEITAQENQLRAFGLELGERERELTRREDDLRVQESRNTHTQRHENEKEHHERELFDTLEDRTNQDKDKREDMATVSPLESPTDQPEEVSEATGAVDAQESQISDLNNPSSDNSVRPLQICLRWIDCAQSEYSNLESTDRRWHSDWHAFDSSNQTGTIRVLLKAKRKGYHIYDSCGESRREVKPRTFYTDAFEIGYQTLYLIRPNKGDDEGPSSTGNDPNPQTQSASLTSSSASIRKKLRT